MAQHEYADLVLENVRALTMDPARPVAAFVAVRGNKIVAVGTAEEVRTFKGRCTNVVDCQGMTLLPGFNDAHCHLMALASSLRGVDCGPDRVGSISQIVEVVCSKAELSPPGQWIRAFGYDEFYLTEKRHPNRWDLDSASPDNPVRLDHRTGHASVLNSAGLALIGITVDTPDPADGVIDRDEATGAPTGLLLEMGDYIGRAVRGSRSRAADSPGEDGAFLEGVRIADRLLLSRGITSIQDAGPSNDLGRWLKFRKLKDEGLLTPRVTMMAGASHLPSFLEAGVTPGSGDGELGLGAVKIMLTLTTGSLQPHREELERLVLAAHGNGCQLAFHAVEKEASALVADILLKARTTAPRPDSRHRIEHCAECPPHVLEKLRRAGAMVVTQPSFLYHNGAKYLSEVEEGLLPHLYPVGALVAAGIPVAAGSDAPVTQPDPILASYSAVTRRTKDGRQLSPSQAIPLGEALKMHTLNGAYATFEEDRKGSIAVGKLADMVLVDGELEAIDPEGIKETEVVMTMVGGEIMWQR